MPSPTRLLTWAELIGPINDELLAQITWGFVLVRCTYTDEARWSLFLTTLKQINPLSDKVAQSQPWTVIEDEDGLANATMGQACLAFKNWIETVGKHENQGQRAETTGRNFYFIYINDESIDSVLNPARAIEKTGNFLVLVDAQAHLITCDETEDDQYGHNNRDQDIRDVLADDPDSSWKLITANEYRGHYISFLREWDPWWDGMNEFNSAPWVHPAFPLGPGDVDRYIKSPDEVGYDVYKMLKQIYGQDHARSVCFEMDEAQTGLQRICGYAGGYRKEDYTSPLYL